MSRSARTIIGLIVVVLIVVVAVLVYIWVTGGSAAPSAALSAPTLDLSNCLPTTVPTLTPALTVEASQEATAEATSAATAESLAATASVTAEASAAVTAAVSAAQGQLVVLNIVPDQSDIHFITHEVLRGSPNTVNGCTRDVAGQIGVDFSNPQNSQVGVIKVDARTFATDNELRNRAIRGEILQSSEDQFEFITLKPTSISGLPTSVTNNQAFEFHITGDLTIRDITKSITFDVTVTPDSQTEIKGSATATVQRSDYNLTIPTVPGVADVDQAVTIQIDFVANTSPAQQPSSSTCSS